jgi:transcriptional regulator with XRE-family HTH domain
VTTSRHLTTSTAAATSKAATSSSSAFERARFRQLFRNQVHDQIVRLFLAQQEQHGLTQKVIAERMGVHPSRINRLLGDPANLTLDTISDLLLAMNAVMTCDVRHVEEPLTKTVTPDIAALLAAIPAVEPTNGGGAVPRNQLRRRPKAVAPDR